VGEPNIIVCSTHPITKKALDEVIENYEAAEGFTRSLIERESRPKKEKQKKTYVKMKIPLDMPPSLEAETSAHGEIIVTFGLHKGKRIKDVPRDYLEWLIKQPPVKTTTSRQTAIELIKGSARKYLETLNLTQKGKVKK
jgi:hypothetical protein